MSSLTLITGLGLPPDVRPERAEVSAAIPLPAFLAGRRKEAAETAISPYAVSAILHLAALAAILIGPREVLEVKPKRIDVPFTQVRIGEQLWYVTPAPLRFPGPAVPARASEAVRPRQPEAPVTERAASRKSPLRQFAAPPDVRTTRVKAPAVIQPAAPDIEVQAIAAPQVAVWTVNAPTARAPLKKFVEPGARGKTLAVSTPQLQHEAASLPEVRTSTVDSPRLTRTFLPPPPATIGKTAREGGESLPGDSVQLIAEGLPLAVRPEQPVSIPQVHSLPGAGGGNELGAPPAPAIPGSAPGRAGASASAEGAAGASRAGVLSGGAGGGIASAGASPSLPANVVRVNTLPAAKFDAVLVQSSVVDSIPESRNLLRGRPIYTVYVAMGTPKDWILHYSDPRNVPPAAPERVVRLDAATPITAPYPIVMFRPNAVISPGERYLVFHGFLETGGRMRDLRAIRRGQADTEQLLLSCLRIWEFRPATRDGVAVEVEILLLVPAQPR